MPGFLSGHPQEDTDHDNVILDDDAVYEAEPGEILQPTKFFDMISLLGPLEIVFHEGNPYFAFRTLPDPNSANWPTVVRLFAETRTIRLMDNALNPASISILNGLFSSGRLPHFPSLKNVIVHLSRRRVGFISTVALLAVPSIKSVKCRGIDPRILWTAMINTPCLALCLDYQHVKDLDLLQELRSFDFTAARAVTALEFLRALLDLSRCPKLSTLTLTAKSKFQLPNAPLEVMLPPPIVFPQVHRLTIEFLSGAHTLLRSFSARQVQVLRLGIIEDMDAEEPFPFADHFPCLKRFELKQQHPPSIETLKSLFSISSLQEITVSVVSKDFWKLSDDDVDKMLRHLNSRSTMRKVSFQRPNDKPVRTSMSLWAFSLFLRRLPSLEDITTGITVKDSELVALGELSVFESFAFLKLRSLHISITTVVNVASDLSQVMRCDPEIIDRVRSHVKQWSGWPILAWWLANSCPSLEALQVIIYSAVEVGYTSSGALEVDIYKEFCRKLEKKSYSG